MGAAIFVLLLKGLCDQKGVEMKIVRASREFHESSFFRGMPRKTYITAKGPLQLSSTSRSFFKMVF